MMKAQVVIYKTPFGWGYNPKRIEKSVVDNQKMVVHWRRSVATDATDADRCFFSYYDVIVIE